MQARASEQNRIEKHLQIAGIKLSSVSSKVFTVSGADMMRHIADGQTDPNKLADLARARMRHKIPALQKVFAVSVSEHVRRLLDVHLRHMDRLDCTIAEIELQIEQKTQIYGDHISQLDAIPGVDVRAAIDILAEIGTDMSPWKTHRQIAAMAGVCPGNYISAGKRLKNRSRQGNPYLKSVLVQVATSAINTKDSYYQAKYIRLKQRRGHKRAVVAIAHAILVAIYYMLKRAEPYRELGAAFTAEELHAKRKTTLLKQLQKLGYQVTLTPVHQTA